jgi:trigger factor
MYSPQESIVKTKLTEKGKWERELEVEVPAERIEAAVAKAVKDYQRRLEIPGFRKGKVPSILVERLTAKPSARMVRNCCPS